MIGILGMTDQLLRVDTASLASPYQGVSSFVGCRIVSIKASIGQALVSTQGTQGEQLG